MRRTADTGEVCLYYPDSNGQYRKLEIPWRTVDIELRYDLPANRMLSFEGKKMSEEEWNDTPVLRVKANLIDEEDGESVQMEFPGMHGASVKIS